MDTAAISRRLARVEGHVRSVRAMVEDGRPVEDVLQQIVAVQAAVTRAAELLVEAEAQECLDILGEDADDDARERLRRLHLSLHRLSGLPRPGSDRRRAREHADDEDDEGR